MQILSAKQIRSFYMRNLPELPVNSTARQFRVRIRRPDGWRFVKIRDRIKNPKDLQKWCLRFLPHDVYFTTSRWLKPEIVGPKTSTSLSSKLFRGSEYYIDIDSKSKSKKISEKEWLRLKFRATKTLAELWTLGYEDFKTVKTNRGYQIWVLDFETNPRRPLKSIADPRSRENYYKQKMTLLTDILKKRGCKFDYPISCNTRCVVRCPNTLHREGTICKFVEELT